VLREVKRHLRVIRSEPPELQNEDSQLWAISYSDFLMVLLSFFIVFFSYGAKNKQSIIERIAILPKEKTDRTLASIPATVPAKESGAATVVPSLSEGLISELKRDLSSYRLELTPMKDKLLVLFPDNIYPSGSFLLDANGNRLLNETLRKLTRYQPELELTFIGHADPRPFTHRRSVLLDNFDLSSLRATRAVQLAIRHGFSPERLKAMGAGENSRKARTLSLMLSPKGGEP
jgi:flagellar motor protein MotB